MIVERDKEGFMTISHNSHIYDIHIQDDATFTIWWRMLPGNAFFRINEYKFYRRILPSMGIISYEIQNEYHVL